MEKFTTFVAFLGLVGVPSIFAMFVYCINAIRKIVNKFDVLMESQQAQMRDSLLKDYKKYVSDGWIDIEDLLEWENRYNKYHSLGANGVMDSKRTSLLSLPNIPPSNATTL